MKRIEEFSRCFRGSLKSSWLKTTECPETWIDYDKNIYEDNDNDGNDYDDSLQW